MLRLDRGGVTRYGGGLEDDSFRRQTQATWRPFPRTEARAKVPRTSAAITYGGYAPVETVAHEFRERFADDGDLAGLKLFLLAGLLVLAALLKRGM